MSERPVTCGEWLAFIEDGGYERPELWLSDGWATVQAEAWEAPALLVRGGRRLVALHPRRAAARRRGRAGLPRELLRGGRLRPLGRRPVADRGRVGGGRPPPADAPCDVGHTFLDHPRPLAPPTSESPGVPPVSLFGDVWQWTSSRLQPLPRLPPAAGAVGEYNGKFMVNQYVLRGGCCVTPPGHVRATYRNFFPPAARWAFTGLRLARDADRSRGRATFVPSPSTSSSPSRTTPRRPGEGRPHRAHAPRPSGCRRCGSTTSRAAGCSTRSPGSPSTTRPGPSGRCSRPMPPRSPPCRVPTRWSSWGRARATRPGCCSRRCAAPARCAGTCRSM